MALSPPVEQAGGPSTPMPSGQSRMDSLGLTASKVQPSVYIPPPSNARREENISCSPIDVTMGRLFPSMPVGALMALMVMPSAQMPVQDGTASPSKGGGEGIVWTGVSRCPEANWRDASCLYYSYIDEEIIQLNHQPQCAGRLYCLFKRMNGTMAASPPPIIGDSFDFSAKPKARRSSDLLSPICNEH
jgi:hypothetical protein